MARPFYGPVLPQAQGRKARPATPEPPCGSYARVQRHYKAGEPIDDACRKAASTYMALYRARSGRTRNVLVPYDVLGTLLAAAPTEVEEWAERRIGLRTTAAVEVATNREVRRG